MTNWYAKAIRELAKLSDADALALVFKIAQKHPKAIVDACPLDTTDEPSWLNECKSLMRAGEKIRAIKLWKNETGQGLKESKEAVEALNL